MRENISLAHRRGRAWFVTLAIAVVASVSGPGVGLARADQIVRVSQGHNAIVKVAKGKTRTVRSDLSFAQIVVGDPDIANVNPLTNRSFYVLGSKLGTTQIALFDEYKQLVGTIDIEVTLDTDRLASTINEALPDNNIQVSSANGRVVLSGEAEDAVAAEKANDIAARFSGDEAVINSLDISSSQQVQLNVRFVEINRQTGHALGTKLGASYTFPSGSVSFNSSPQASGSGTPAASLVGSLVSGGFSADVAIQALEDRGVARLLAQPNLIARSGEKASFLAGGEFPIPVSGDNNSVTIEYKRYGVSLEFTPTVLKHGLISLDIAPEVSAIDRTASYQIGNISVPGFVVRRAHTSVDLKSGQSFMIAGLLQSSNDIDTQRLPGIRKIPVLGALLSSKAYQRHETDLVILVTPYLVKPVDPTVKLRTPADSTKPPSNVDYLLGDTEEVRTVAAANPMAMSGPAAGHYLDLPEN